ncbi:hypothetical protein ACFX2J_018794 [Malus domestica]
MTRFVRILPFFYNGFRGTFVDRFNLPAGHLDILWFWLTFPHIGHTCALLSKRNAAFSKLLAQFIKLRAPHPNYPIKSIRLDNAGEFTSKTFDDYCMSVGVEVEHPVPHVHTQNGLAEAFIKRLQMIARSLVIRTKLPIAAWGHAILHAAKLVRLRPIAT